MLDAARRAVTIRTATEDDLESMWSIFRAIVSCGETYPFVPHTPRDEAAAYWLAPGATSYVAEDESRIVGMYKIVPNQPGLGSHVANASFMVDPSCSGRGVGRQMGEHCLGEARRQGYLAMQFNFVVSTNERAVKLWHSLGFETVGRLPGAFAHPSLGDVDVLVMYQKL
jgi:ribosomal protein S18 acetylase RimI-like enzyme